MAIGALVRRLGALLRWRQRDRELRDEIALHLALREAQEAARGAAPGPAAARARQAFGSALQYREAAREAWGWMWLDRGLRDLRLAARTLARTPAFAVGAVGSLALGVAVVASAMAVMNAYLIRALPYPYADRVHHVMYAPPGPWEPNNLQQLDWAAAADLIEYPLISSADTLHVLAGSPGPPLRTRRVSYGVVSGLTLRMSAGRPLVESDFGPAEEPVAVLGDEVWRQRFGADPGLLGRMLDTETEAGRRERVRIVGILPEHFYIGGDSRQPIDMVVPFTAAVRTYYLVRLRAGVPPGAVEARLTDAVRQVATNLPPDWTGVHLESAGERYAGTLRPLLTGVTAAAVLVLAIVCANVGVLTVLRTTRRQAEVAVRLALGASRGRIARMLASEACLVVAASLALGLLITRWTLGLLAPRIETELGRPAPAGTASIAVDPTVVLAMAGIGVLLTLGLSCIPLFGIRSAGVSAVLRRTTGATTGGRAMTHWRSSMLAAEIAVTLVLLVGCGAMVRSAITMLRTDLGFQPEVLTRARIALRASDYADAAAYRRFFEEFTRRTSTATGFPVAFSSWPAFADFPERAIEADDRNGHVLSAGAINAAPAYFATMGIRLRQGRDFAWDDIGEPVAVISESLAGRLWPGISPIGRRVRQTEITAGGARPPGAWQTIVGVAADVRQRYGDENLNDIYTPWLPDIRFGSFFLRNGGQTDGVLPVLRATAVSIDPRAVVDLFHAAADDNRELAGTAFLSVLFTTFAAVAGVIAMLGIYAVTAYAAQQREREVAIRMALGASRAAVLWLFLRHGAVVLLVGIVAGLAASAAATRLMAHHVFGMHTFGAAALALTCVVLAVPSVAAIWWPANRASRQNVTMALKDV